MSPEVIFHTPGTGIPDLEMRITLGLAAAALQVVENPETVVIKEDGERYQVCVENIDKEEWVKSLAWCCANRLSDEEKLGRLPGLQREKKYSGQLAEFARIARNDAGTIAELLSHPCERFRKHPKELVCGHTWGTGEKWGTLMLFTPYQGSPPKRSTKDSLGPWNRGSDPPEICPICFAAALLGLEDFQISTNNGRLSYFPRFRGRVTGDKLAVFMASARVCRGKNFGAVPERAVLLLLMAHAPDLAKFGDACAEMFVTSLRQPSGKGWQPKFVTQSRLTPHVEFLKAPYRCAFVLTVSEMKEQHRASISSYLTHALENKDRKAAVDVCRLYAGAQLEAERFPFVHEDVTLYLAGKEVCNVDKKLIAKGSPEYKSIQEVASMLKFFVKERNFGHVDNLRKARNVSEFARLLTDATRVARSIALDPDPKKSEKGKPFIPSQETLRQVVELANEPEQLQDVQTLLALLAFTVHREEENQ